MTLSLVTDLNDIRRLAADRHAEFEALRDALEFDGERSDAALDALVDAIAEPVAAAIDCTRCANCCRTLDVCLIPSDIERLSAALVIPVSDVMTRYADQERGQAQGEWAIIPQYPCPFLDGTLCSIYDQRPHACRLYPQFTPDVRYNLEDIIEGAAVCPIIYNVLSVLAETVLPHEDAGSTDAG